MILCDGSSLLHRILHTEQAHLSDSRGRPTGGTHGFIVSLGSTANTFRRKHQILVAWDLGVPLHRREIYSEYKAHKIPVGDVGRQYKSEQNLLMASEEAPSEFLQKYVMTRNLLHKSILPKIGCITVQAANVEADDIIAYVCDRLKNEELIVFTEDRDLIQLLSDKITVFSGRTQEVLDIKTLIELHNLERDKWHEHWLLTRAICGDTSDGVPGIAGVGWTSSLEYARQIVQMGLPLSVALSKVSRIPGGKKAGFEALQAGYAIIKRNLKLMDLGYAILLNLPIISDIKAQIAGNFIYKTDPDAAELELHELQLMKAKQYATMILQSNLEVNKKDDYVRRLS